MKILKHSFVEHIPGKLEEGILYISIPYETIIHKCCCGCGNEVVTPLSPADWSMTFDGDTITLNPSIGNWNFECKSHYFIRENRVEWARKYTIEEIEEVKNVDLKDKLAYLNKHKSVEEIENKNDIPNEKSWFVRWWRGIFR